MNHLPLYKCHKQVRAALIEHVDLKNGTIELKTTHASILVSAAWYAKNQPKTGGYYVVYEDGYTSFSPATAFESGYTRI